MKTEHFRATSLRVEAQRTDNGWTFTAWRPNVSQGFADSASLLRWCKWPTKTPTGDALRQWLRGLEDAPVSAPEAAPVASSWDPVALEPGDPNHQTRTIV